LLTIDSKNAEEFNQSLLHYYNTADKGPLLACLTKCIKSMERNLNGVRVTPKHDKEEMER